MAATKAFTMRSLRQLGVWGATAAGALLIAMLTTRSEVGSQRVGIVLASLSGSVSPFRPGHATTPVAAHSFDAEAETHRLTEAVRGLAAQSDQLRSRVAAVEHNMDDVTGSITRQIEAVRSEVSAPWPADEEPAPPTPAVMASVVTPVVPPPAGLSSRLPPSPLTPDPSTPAQKQPPDNARAAAAPPAQYGVDVGSALSIQALHARWAGIRSAHPHLFEGLQPVVTLREIPRSSRVELRLVVGPLASAEAAAQLCASLSSSRVFCEPTTFGGQHLVLR